MGNLSEFLMEELNVATAFTIPIFGGIEVAESTVISWVIMAIIVILTLVLTRNMRVEKPGKLQVGVEYTVTALQNLVRGIIGHEGERYVPYLSTVLVFLGISNIFAIFGMKPPTKDLNVTAALALMSIILVQAALLLDGEVNETISQRAAKDILDRAGVRVPKESRSDVVIRFAQGAPPLGMPESAEKGKEERHGA